MPASSFSSASTHWFCRGSASSWRNPASSGNCRARSIMPDALVEAWFRSSPAAASHSFSRSAPRFLERSIVACSSRTERAAANWRRSTASTEESAMRWEIARGADAGSRAEHGGPGGRIGEIFERAAGAARHQCVGPEVPGAHTDRLGADRLGCGDVFGCVANHDNPALLERDAETFSPAARADADELRSLLVIASESTEREPLVDADPLQLHPRALANVPGAQPHGDMREAGGRVEDLAHPAVQAVATVVDAADLFLEHGDVVLKHEVDLRVGIRPPDAAEPTADDRPVRHAVEAEVPAGVVALVEKLEDLLERTPAGAAGGDERAIDIEEKDRRLHVRLSNTERSREQPPHTNPRGGQPGG